MKEIRIRIVDSISEEMEQIQNRIRMRAYQKFTERVDDTDSALEDWLSAERELICILHGSVAVDDTKVTARIDIPGSKPSELEVQIAGQDVLVLAEIQGLSPSKSDPGSDRSAFGVIRLPVAIDPAGVHAEFSKGVLRLTALLSAAVERTLKKTA